MHRGKIGIVGRYAVSLVVWILLPLCLPKAQDIAPSAWQKERSGWKPYLSEGGKFQVLVPFEMKEQVDSADTPVGKLFNHTFICKDGPDLDYVITYVDYPPQAIPPDSIELKRELLQATLEEEAGSSGGELVYAEDALIEGYPGKIWRINIPDKRAVIRSRAFIAGDRFYIVRTVASRAKALNPSSDRFLSSFRLLR